MNILRVILFICSIATTRQGKIAQLTDVDKRYGVNSSDKISISHHNNFPRADYLYEDRSDKSSVIQNTHTNTHTIEDTFATKNMPEDKEKFVFHETYRPNETKFYTSVMSTRKVFLMSKLELMLLNNKDPSLTEIVKHTEHIQYQNKINLSTFKCKRRFVCSISITWLKQTWVLSSSETLSGDKVNLTQHTQLRSLASNHSLDELTWIKSPSHLFQAHILFSGDRSVAIHFRHRMRLDQLVFKELLDKGRPEFKLTTGKCTYGLFLESGVPEGYLSASW